MCLTKLCLAKIRLGLFPATINRENRAADAQDGDANDANDQNDEEQQQLRIQNEGGGGGGANQPNQEEEINSTSPLKSLKLVRAVRITRSSITGEEVCQQLSKFFPNLTEFSVSLFNIHRRFRHQLLAGLPIFGPKLIKSSITCRHNMYM